MHFLGLLHGGNVIDLFGCRAVFERADDFEVVGESGTLADALTKVADLTPDVVIFDVRLPDGNGLDGVRQVRQRIVVADQHATVEARAAVWRAALAFPLSPREAFRRFASPWWS